MSKYNINNGCPGKWPLNKCYVLVINRINAISRKALRLGVTHTAFDIAEIINKFDRKLFSQIIHSGHCLYHLLPPKNPCTLPL